ncbi:MAG: anti-sigma factor antagonist [Proteobacteria bacterium]|nr:anti-sigma factor antagonist [Pseudomonadota bacterium]
MNLTPNAEPGHLTLQLPPQLNAEVGSQFRTKIREALGRSPKQLTIDCTHLTYIDSTGLGLLTLARSEAARIGCQITLANVGNNHPRKVLELMKFNQLFTITYQSEGQTEGQKA